MEKIKIDLEKMYNEILPIIKEDLKDCNDITAIEKYYNEYLKLIISDYFYDNYLEKIEKIIKKLLTNNQ